MTFREAYDELCDYLRRGWWSDDFEDAIRFYINEVDKLTLELIRVRHSNEVLRNKLKHATTLKEKYYKELKECRKVVINNGT